MKDYMSYNEFNSIVKVPSKNLRKLTAPTMFFDIKTIERRFGKNYLDNTQEIKIEFTEK